MLTHKGIGGGIGCWEDVFASTHKSPPELCSPDFSEQRVLNLSAWYPPLAPLGFLGGFAGLTAGGLAGGFFSAALPALGRMAQKSPAPWRRSSDHKAHVRTGKPEAAEIWAARSLPQSEFVLSLLKWCSGCEGPDLRENLMVTIDKGVENTEFCFNRKPPNTEEAS